MPHAGKRNTNDKLLRYDNFNFIIRWDTMLGIVKQLHLTKLSNKDNFVHLYISICAAVVQNHCDGEFL